MSKRGWKHTIYEILLDQQEEQKAQSSDTGRKAERTCWGIGRGQSKTENMELWVTGDRTMQMQVVTSSENWSLDERTRHNQTSNILHAICGIIDQTSSLQSIMKTSIGTWWHKLKNKIDEIKTSQNWKMIYLQNRESNHELVVHCCDKQAKLQKHPLTRKDELYHHGSTLNMRIRTRKGKEISLPGVKTSSWSKRRIISITDTLSGVIPTTRTVSNICMSKNKKISREPDKMVIWLSQNRRTVYHRDKYGITSEWRNLSPRNREKSLFVLWRPSQRVHRVRFHGDILSFKRLSWLLNSNGSCDSHMGSFLFSYRGTGSNRSGPDTGNTRTFWNHLGFHAFLGTRTRLNRSLVGLWLLYRSL